MTIVVNIAGNTLISRPILWQLQSPSPLGRASLDRLAKEVLEGADLTPVRRAKISDGLRADLRHGI